MLKMSLLNSLTIKYFKSLKTFKNYKFCLSYQGHSTVTYLHFELFSWNNPSFYLSVTFTLLHIFIYLENENNKHLLNYHFFLS